MSTPTMDSSVVPFAAPGSPSGLVGDLSDEEEGRKPATATTGKDLSRVKCSIKFCTVMVIRGVNKIFVMHSV